MKSLNKLVNASLKSVGKSCRALWRLQRSVESNFSYLCKKKKHSLQSSSSLRNPQVCLALPIVRTPLCSTKDTRTDKQKQPLMICFPAQPSVCSLLKKGLLFFFFTPTGYLFAAHHSSLWLRCVTRLHKRSIFLSQGTFLTDLGNQRVSGWYCTVYTAFQIKVHVWTSSSLPSVFLELKWIWTQLKHTVNWGTAVCQVDIVLSPKSPKNDFLQLLLPQISPFPQFLIWHILMNVFWWMLQEQMRSVKLKLGPGVVLEDILKICWRHHLSMLKSWHIRSAIRLRAAPRSNPLPSCRAAEWQLVATFFWINRSNGDDCKKRPRAVFWMEYDFLKARSWLFYMKIPR